MGSHVMLYASDGFTSCASLPIATASMTIRPSLAWDKRIAFRASFVRKETVYTA